MTIPVQLLCHSISHPNLFMRDTFLITRSFKFTNSLTIPHTILRLYPSITFIYYLCGTYKPLYLLYLSTLP